MMMIMNTSPSLSSLFASQIATQYIVQNIELQKWHAVGKASAYQAGRPLLHLHALLIFRQC